MNDIIELEKEEYFTIKGHLVRRIEVLPGAKGDNVSMYNSKIATIFVNAYQRSEPNPQEESEHFSTFADTLESHQQEYDVDFIFRYQSNTVFVERIVLRIK